MKKFSSWLPWVNFVSVMFLGLAFLAHTQWAVDRYGHNDRIHGEIRGRVSELAQVTNAAFESFADHLETRLAEERLAAGLRETAGNRRQEAAQWRTATARP